MVALTPTRQDANDQGWAALIGAFNPPAAVGEPLAAWLPAASPAMTWDWPYLRHIREHLDGVTDGRIKRLMIMVPPRHGKSTLATIHYPAWRLERDPSTRVVIACYNSTLAEKFSRRVRAIVRRRGMVRLDRERQAVDDWLTTDEGGLRAVGVGSGITGQGADIVLIDDPVKSREEADSPAYRERCWEWYTEDLYTRLEPGAAVVLIQTRWHDSDLAGRILASDQADDWTVVRLPAEAEEGDPLGRPLGAALCPARYPLPALKDLERTLTAYPYAALYQQRPVPKSGGMFKAAAVGYIDAPPTTVAGTRWTRWRAWDLAAGGGKGDSTAGVLMAVTAQGRYVVEDVVRGQWATDERDAAILGTAMADGPGVRIWIPQDPAAAGKSQVLYLVKQLYGYRVTAELNSGNKEVRAGPFSSQWNAGNVDLVRAPWNAAYVAELVRFPYAHDDQVDASSDAFRKLSETRTYPRAIPVAAEQSNIWR